ncbi:ABC transporter permease [Verminephrobacter eiseniae]|uniref:ABC transporter permease n=1 Tax=Verminephrobacter eiseniae TaxID=364317 RepID=UPI0010E4AC5B|nr:ABC transporter permease [Verminephrobacter eiseniae]KAB7614024.1 ABC transporter permease [Verminephrobacter sp. Larva24]MCW5231065.1 ABC transporter permease [Verminephrobacter eiseniae]MCW5292798.1 ABC transporter permease [Verminephrobacter eiseniae]MCW8188036.1 ABC transporter permease [Verminephrobacter eiseniae]MCW8226291.1 ABC transporter permease [Verminephrobacter eiseniae]
MSESSSPGSIACRAGSIWAIRQNLGRRLTGALAVAGLLVPLLGWVLAAGSGLADPVFLPGPAAVLGQLFSWMTQDGLLADAGISVLRVVGGWALSALVALPLGLCIGTWRSVQALLEALIDFIRYMPAVAFVPLVMLWVGIDEGAKIAIIFIGTFFQMVLMVAEDVRLVPMAQIEAAQTMGASRGEIVQYVILPAAKPALLDTLRITMGWAWTYLVVAELVAANSGLGFAILKAQRFLQTDKIFAGILLIGAIGLLSDQLFRLAHRLAFPWLHARG